MSIEVVCPNGHALRLKEKYAGKSGLCPHCHSRVEVPHLLRDEDVLGYLGDWIAPPAPVESPSESDDADVLDQTPRTPEHESGLSLLGSSIIRHNKVCPQCHGVLPHWFATCSKCGLVFRDFEVGQARPK
jgi:hypothetical protein